MTSGNYGKQQRRPLARRGRANGGGENTKQCCVGMVVERPGGTMELLHGEVIACCQCDLGARRLATRPNHDLTACSG
jgi:hypothetical protein